MLTPEEREELEQLVGTSEDVKLDPKERDELERILNDPSSEALIAEELRHLALDGIDEAMAGRAEQEAFGSGDNTAYAFVNDWVSNRYAPHIAAWHNSAMLFRRMLEHVESGNLDDALRTGQDGYTSLADTQDAWDAYTGEALRLRRADDRHRRRDPPHRTSGNLRLAGVGTAGGVIGAGKRLSEFAAGVIALLVNPGRATYDFFKSVQKVVDAAFRYGRIYAKDPAEFMPKVIDALSRQSSESLERLSKLPPDQQAWAVGQFFGEIEGDLIPLAAAGSIGGSLRAGATVATGLEGSRILQGRARTRASPKRRWWSAARRRRRSRSPTRCRPPGSCPRSRSQGAAGVAARRESCSRARSPTYGEFKKRGPRHGSRGPRGDPAQPAQGAQARDPARSRCGIPEQPRYRAVARGARDGRPLPALFRGHVPQPARRQVGREDHLPQHQGAARRGGAGERGPRHLPPRCSPMR